MFRVEDETMSLVDGVEGLVAARVVGLDDVAADGKRKKSATGRRRKREDTTLTNSPANHTRAQRSKLKGSRLF